MFKSYVKIAWRNLVKDKRFTLLNLIGLSTGLASALLIYLWVGDELRIDKFHQKDAQLYQVLENRVQTSGIWTASTSSGPMAPSLAKDMPEVEYAVATVPTQNITFSLTKEKNLKANGKYADKDFFNMFSYQLQHGTANEVLADKHSIVLSNELALKIFGTTENITGKTVELQHQFAYTVSGVFTAPGHISSDQFDFVLPFQLLRDSMQSLNNFNSTGNYTYITLKPGSNVAQFNAKIANYVRQKTNNEVTHRTPFITRYSAVYLHGHYNDGKPDGGRIDYVHLFSIIALFILVIACINFMNLSTAKAAQRAKEVGLKKAIGASRGALMIQYLGESMLMAIAAQLLALLMVVLLLPAFNGITGKQLDLQHLGAGFALSVIAITLITGLVAGSYPALHLSGFRPAQVLKGKVAHSAGELFIRKGLMVFQFTLSIILIVAVLVVYKQISFIQTKSLGYNRDHIITFFKEGKLDNAQSQESFLTEARKVPGITSAAAIGHSLTGHSSGTYGVKWPGKDLTDKTEFEDVPVNIGAMETLGMTLKEGRTFSRSYPGDTAKIIFNEAAIQFMHLQNPVGKVVELWGDKMQIIGVANDFHFQSLHEKIKPLFLRLAPGDTYRLLFKIETGKEQSAIAALQHLYQQFNPGFSFDYAFLDENYQNLYTAERRVSVLSGYFAILAILISCLGLFGLAAFTAQRRNKEIGIRKVLGATAGAVVLLLSKDFLKLVLVAICIAFPLAWWGSDQWLKGFAYRIHPGAGVFILSALLIMVLTFCIISFQSIKAALTNPVKSLKSGE